MSSMRDADFPGRIRLSPDLPKVCRLGMATRTDGRLEVADIQRAIDAGIGYFNWCGESDALSRAVAGLSSENRGQMVIAFQLEARDGAGTARELEAALLALRTDTIDVVTFYYVEHESEWQQIVSEGGAREAMLRAREAGKVRLLGMTTHQRDLAARIAATGQIELLMIRYNAAHRGAESEIFPTTRARGIPVVTFTAQRWGALAQSTPEDPPEFTPPPPIDWYRYVLAQPDIGIALMAPLDGRELQDNLRLLNDRRPPTASELDEMRAHGDRVRRWAGQFE